MLPSADRLEGVEKRVLERNHWIRTIMALQIVMISNCSRMHILLSTFFTRASVSLVDIESSWIRRVQTGLGRNYRILYKATGNGKENDEEREEQREGEKKREGQDIASAGDTGDG